MHTQISLAQHAQTYDLSNTRVPLCTCKSSPKDGDKSHDKPFFSLVSFIPQGRETFGKRKRERASGLLPGLLNVTAGVVISTGSLCLCVVMCRHRELWESWVISADEKQMAAEVQ